MKWNKVIKCGYIDTQTINNQSQTVSSHTFRVEIIRETQNFYEVKYLSSVKGHLSPLQVSNKETIIPKEDVYDLHEEKRNWFQGWLY